MSAWLIVGLVPVALWALWAWLGHLFDHMSEYHHHWKAEGDLEDATPARGTGSSS